MRIFTAASQEALKVLAEIFKSVAGTINRDSDDEIDVLKIYAQLMKGADFWAQK